MDTVRINIKGERQTGLRFEEFPDALREDLREEIDSLTADLFAKIRAVAPKETGDLQSKINAKIHDHEKRIVGSIYIAGKKGSQDFAKAGALEYGAHRTTKVKEYARRPHGKVQAKFDAPAEVIVRAHTRKNKQSEHAFLRGPMASARQEVENRLNAVVEKNVAKANQ